MSDRAVRNALIVVAVVEAAGLAAVVWATMR